MSDITAQQKGIEVGDVVVLDHETISELSRAYYQRNPDMFRARVEGLIANDTALRVVWNNGKRGGCFVSSVKKLCVNELREDV